jgi:predicted RNA-binding Zn ribbon-like protein
MRYHGDMSVTVRPLPLPELVSLVNDWGTRPRQIGNRTEPPPTPDSAAASAVADRLHAVFTAADPAERARLVTAMLTEAVVRPELAEADGGLVAAWQVPDPGAALLASAALALREHLAAHPERIGVCHDRQCADVYVDASPGGHRRFCSLTCQNRARVAAFRERRRTAGA